MLRQAQKAYRKRAPELTLLNRFGIFASTRLQKNPQLLHIVVIIVKNKEVVLYSSSHISTIQL